MHLRLRSLAWFALAIAAGCAYQLGNVPTEQLSGVRSIFVPVARNKSYEPTLSVPLTDAVIQRLHTDGTLRVVREGNADASLLIEIVQVERRPLRNVRGDSRLVAELRVEMEAEITLFKRGRTLPLIDRETISGETEFFIGSDQQEGERQALGLAAEDLAENIVQRVTEDW